MEGRSKGMVWKRDKGNMDNIFLYSMTSMKG